jgi:hypothetical protein
MRPAAALLAAAVTSALAGCAHVQELPDGSRRVTGFVSMTIPAAIPQASRGADVLEVSALGVLLVSGPAGGSFSIGYASERIVSVRNDALVVVTEEGE